MKSTLQTTSIYDLSNPHFQNVEILTKKGESIKGQFVQFKVIDENIEYLYPAERFCFLPDEHKKAFWKIFDSNNGEFKEFPAYVLEFTLIDIEKISILPVAIAN